jgi:hypothetical protein
LPTYERYRRQRINDIFSPETMKNSIYLPAYLMETSLFLNDGSGHFTLKRLPMEVQFSTVMTAETGDFNGDGKLDILMGGNLYHVKPEVGRYDASYGSLLLGDGTGGFENIPKKESGFWLEGEIRDMLEVSTRSGRFMVIARCDGPLQVFRMLQ